MSTTWFYFRLVQLAENGSFQRLAIKSLWEPSKEQQGRRHGVSCPEIFVRPEGRVTSNEIV